MIKLNCKKKQTYEEALMAMQDRQPPIHHLNEIAKRHQTEELIILALKNGHCSLKDISEELLTKKICVAALETGNSSEIKYIPQKYFDYEFALQAASWCPRAITTIMYRFRYNRWKNPYTDEDMRIIAEAACPKAIGRNRLLQFSSSDEELNGRSFEQYCSDTYGVVDNQHTYLFKQALDHFMKQ